MKRKELIKRITDAGNIGTDILMNEDFMTEVDIKEFPDLTFILYKPIVMKEKSHEMILYKAEKKRESF